MLIEIEGERFMVLAATVNYPVVHYSTPSGVESVEYGAEARVVTVNSAPAETHCGDCAATLAQHCVECNECPMTDGPCWCGAASYKSEGRPAKAAEAHEHFEGCPWVEGGTETCDCAEPAQIASEAPGGTDAPQTPAEPAATSPQGRAALLAAMVAETMTIPTEVRYARAYGVLSGLVRGLLTDTHRIEMAQSYVEQLDEAIAAEHR
jgi:hypothetical protein